MFANDSSTTYYWTIKANDSGGHWTNKTFSFQTATYSWSNWSNWWTFNFTSDAPSAFTATAFNETAINITWTKGTGADTTRIIRNATGYANYPNTPTNGTLVYNDSNIYYNDTGLKSGTTYYYSAWSYNASTNNFSLAYAYDSATTTGTLSVYHPYPANESTEQSRPVSNLSLGINSSGLWITIRWYNHTQYPHVWEIHKYFNDAVGSRRFADNVSTDSTGKGFKWGNTTFYWMVNVTDNSTWVNNTYYYNTTRVISGKNARMDVTANDAIDVFDLSQCWANNDVTGTTYDGINDVTQNGAIDVFDLSAIWAQKTS